MLSSDHKELFENIWFVDKSTPSQHRKELFASKNPDSRATSVAYEMTSLFIELAENQPTKDGKIDMPALEEKIKTLKNYNVDGTFVSTDETSFISYDVSYYVFKDGKIVPLEE